MFRFLGELREKLDFFQKFAIISMIRSMLVTECNFLIQINDKK